VYEWGIGGQIEELKSRQCAANSPLGPQPVVSKMELERSYVTAPLHQSDLVQPCQVLLREFGPSDFRFGVVRGAEIACAQSPIAVRYEGITPFRLTNVAAGRGCCIRTCCRFRGVFRGVVSFAVALAETQSRNQWSPCTDVH